MSLTSNSSTSVSTSNSIANISNTPTSKQLSTSFGSTTNQSANRYSRTGTSTAMSTSGTPLVGTLQSLGLMMATRFSNDPSSRHQTVILHPRPINPCPKTTVSTCNAVSIATTSVTSLKTGATVPINANSSHQSIPVRTAISSGSQNAHQQGATVKQICTPAGRSFNITSTLPFESLGLVVTNDSNNTRRIGIHPSADMNIVNIKSGSATSGSASVSNIHQSVTKLAAVARTNAQPKMVSISSVTTPQSTGNMNSVTGQSLTRLNIIGQLPGGTSTVNSTSANKPVINIAATLSKPVILNPAPNVVTPAIVPGTGTNVHNLINVGNINTFSTGVAQNQHKSGVVPVNQTVVTLTATTTSNGVQSRHTLINSSNVHHSQSQPRIASSAANSLTPQSFNQTHLATSIGSSSPLKPNILSSPANSPVKQIQQSTPSSPRPSILIRKRIGGDGQGNSAFTTAYKSPNSSSKLSNITTNDVLKTPKKKIDEKEDNDKQDIAAQEVNCQLGTPNSDGATPRKKPRKQLLEPFNLTTSHNIKLLSSNDDICKGRLDGDVKQGFEDSSMDNGVITIHKKPRPSILTTYVPWKSLQYHFLRYSDVKQKSEKKLTLSEISNEGLQRKNGWKVHHLVAHIEETDEEESQIFERLKIFLENFEKDNNSLLSCNVNLLGLSCRGTGIGSTIPLFDKLTDLIRGNLQRSKLFQEQINEAKHLLIKLTNDHKERVGKLTKKCANKRTYINK